jgi:hypothetical protein
LRLTDSQRDEPASSARRRRPYGREHDAPARHASLERFPFERNRSNDKKSLKIKTLEQALIEKVYQLF